jgi:hypothetical protein
MARHVFEWCFDVGRGDRDHPEKDTLFLNRIPSAQFFEAQVFVAAQDRTLTSLGCQAETPNNTINATSKVSAGKQIRQDTYSRAYWWSPRDLAKEVSSPEGRSLHNQKGETGA